jgi:hypothetical protein
MQNQDQNFTEEEYRTEMKDFVARLEAQDASLSEVRRQYLLDYLRNHKGIEIISIENNVVFFKRVENNYAFMFVGGGPTAIDTFRIYTTGIADDGNIGDNSYGYEWNSFVRDRVLEGLGIEINKNK